MAVAQRGTSAQGMPPLQEDAGFAVLPDSVWASKRKTPHRNSQLTALAATLHKTQADSKTHLHRAEDRATGTLALQREAQPRASWFFGKENSSSLHLAPKFETEAF